MALRVEADSRVPFACAVLTRAEIQHLRALREKKEREAQARFVVEGEKVVNELMREGIAFEKIYTIDASRFARDDRVLSVTPDEMARISHFPTPSSVLAVGKLVRAQLAEGELEKGLTLALDGVQDSGNVGTLLRIADWFGFDRVILSPDCADLFSQKVINASMGSFARVRAISVDLAKSFDGISVPILGCDLSGAELHQINPLPHAIVVIGSEGRGLSQQVGKCVTTRVTIPRYGRAESLNAGVAAGIVCAHLARHRPASAPV